ncbi:MAG TPA: hypothetical protein VII36_01990 [Usitatibacter sp.]
MRAPSSFSLRFSRLILACLAVASAAFAAPDDTGPGAILRAKHAHLREKLESNAFGRELFLVSNEGPTAVGGDVYAILDFPFAKVASALGEARSWCDVLILPFNTKHCFAPGEGATRLSVRVGRKAEQPAEQAFPIEFNYRVVASIPDYFRVMLNADKGPLGTRDYRMALEATPLDEGRTFVHLGYSYGFNMISRLAMQAYLRTAGASKVGFTVEGRDAQGRPSYVGGMLGATERNTMRYFLAIEAYLASLAAPPSAQVDKRLSDWFAATEKYSRQLHEMDRGEYLAMKRKETKRLSAAL